jgi:hypothetical protein
MSYAGYAKLIARHAKKCEIFKEDKSVSILEIGVDRGQTALPVIHNLLMYEANWTWVGVDIRADGAFDNQLAFMEGVRRVDDRKNNLTRNVEYLEANSLDFLPRIAELNPNFVGFDVILIDGDHNYETVAQELSYLDKISHPFTMCILDDYHGKHATRDSFYADSEKHQGLNHKTLERDASVQGVKPAVDEFLKDNPLWKAYDLRPEYEPIVICREQAYFAEDEDGMLFTSFLSDNEE